MEGHLLTVRENPWTFLHHARHEEKDIDLWVDALCICFYRITMEDLGILRFAPQFSEEFNFPHLVSQIWQYIPCI